MRRLLLVTALLVLAAPAMASAATIDGGGWGHGVGLSQYGAYGLALHGRSYDDILYHYYRGTRLSQADPEPIRVLLQASRSSSGFSGATRAGGRRVDPARVYGVTRAGSALELRSGRRVVARFRGSFRVTSGGGVVRLHGQAMNGVTSGRYRGAINFHPGLAGGVTAVNAASLDEYVRGVVPRESPPSWHMEALKAQAVAARSYALATNVGGSVFDQYPDTRSQVYGGVSAEHPRTDRAVRETANEVLRYDGRIAVTYFFSTSGGHTENVENVFYGSDPKPYLRGVPDPYDNISPLHRWTSTRSSVRSLRILRRGVSGRVISAELNGQRVSGATLQYRLGLRDRLIFRVTR